MMAEQSLLGDLPWEEWFSTLAPDVQASPEGAGLLMSAGHADAPKFVAKMLEADSEIDVNGCLVASMSAFGEGDFQRANQFLKRAFELDLASALRQTVMRFSAQTSKILEGSPVGR